MKLKNAYKIAIILFLIAYKASACQHSHPGDFMNKDDIIEFGTNIVLVKAYRDAESQPLKFKVEEILKASAPSLDQMLDKYIDKYRNFENDPHTFSRGDFNGHQDPWFWHTDFGRSPRFGGSCWPAHVFKEGRTYLLFPEFQASQKSAEQIDSTDDLWYRYVKRRLQEIADLTVKVHIIKSEETKLSSLELITFPTAKTKTSTTFLSSKMKYRLMRDLTQGNTWNRNRRDVWSLFSAGRAANDISLKQSIFAGRYFLYLEADYILPEDTGYHQLGCYISAKSFKFIPEKPQVFEVTAELVKHNNKMSLNCRI